MVLFSYHVFLMCTGQTTKEHLTKGKNKEGEAGGGAAGSKDTVLEEDVDEDVKVCARRGQRLVNPRAWIPFPERLLDPPLLPPTYNMNTGMDTDRDNTSR